MTNKQRFSFRKGWRQLKVTDAPIVKTRIIAALGLKCKSSFYPRLNGKYEPKISEAEAIEAIFREYGITDIWGEA